MREEDYVGLGERPFLEFPPSTIEEAIQREGKRDRHRKGDKDGESDRDRSSEKGRLDLFVRFSRLLGPQGRCRST